MAIATNAQKEATALGYTGNAPYASLHTADPGTTGTSEVTGGSPAYARKALTWTGGSSDGVVTTGSVDFDVPAGTTLAYAGLWTAITGGTFLDKTAISATFVSQGVYRVTFTYTQS